MAAKTGKLTANRARKEKFLRRDFDDLGVQMGVGGVTSPIAVLGITWQRLGGEDMGSRQWAGRHQLWQVNPIFHYQGDKCDRGHIGSLRWCCWRERRHGTKHSRGTQAGDKKGLKKGLRGPIGSRLGKGMTGICTYEKVIKWLVHQSRPSLRAKVSAVKLEE